MPTAHKLRWVDALVAAGLREIEVGSFVPATRLPQLADTAELVLTDFRDVSIGRITLETPAEFEVSPVARATSPLAMPAAEGALRLHKWRVEAMGASAPRFLPGSAE